MRHNRRTALKLAGVSGLAALGLSASNGGLRLSDTPGIIHSPSEFFSTYQAHYYGGYPTTHIPHDLRRPNTDGSCVHLSTGICLMGIGEYDLAQQWMNSYRGGEYSSRHLRRMDEQGLLFSVEVDGNPDFVDFWAGHTNSVAKRVMGVSYNTRHVMNLIDIDPPSQGAKAFLLNNQRRSGDWNWNSPVAAETSRQEFLSNWDRNGGWAFTILGTKDGVVSPVPPIPYV